MLKRGILYSVVVLVLMAAGFLVTRTLIEDPAQPDRERPRETDRSAPTRKVETSEASGESGVEDAGAGAAVVEVVELKGSVTAGDDENGWAPVEAGQRLGVDDEGAHRRRGQRQAASG